MSAGGTLNAGRGEQNAGLRHAEMPRVEALTRGGGKRRAEMPRQDAG